MRPFYAFLIAGLAIGIVVSLISVANKSGKFSLIGANTVSTATQPSILIFVDEATYSALPTELNRLAADIRSDLGAQVVIQHANYTSAVPIRNVIKDYYNTKGLIGSILIGNIPTFTRSDGFYTDWFYQDLSDVCQISSNGTYIGTSLDCNSLSTITEREVFVGRITPPLKGTAGIPLIKSYLDKNHTYRTGGITYNKKLLVYPSVDIELREKGIFVTQNSLETNLNYALPFLNTYSRGDVDLFQPRAASTTAKADYLAKLKNNNYEMAIISIHGTPTTQNTGNGEVTSLDIKAAAPNIFYVNLLSCSNGSFKEENYLAGWLLFSGNTLVVNAMSNLASVSTLLSDPPAVPVYFLHSSTLRLGIPLGEMARRDDSLYIAQTFGDPTLRMRPLGSGPKLAAVRSLNFGQVIGGKSATMPVIVRNDGTSPLELVRKVNPMTIVDGKILGFDIEIASGLDFLGFLIREINYFSKVSIPPGTQKEVKISFAPPVYKTTKLTKTGKYVGLERFITNDPKTPYLEIQLTGEGVLATSTSQTPPPSIGPVVLIPAKTTIGVAEPLSVKWDAGPVTTYVNDWIALVPQGSEWQSGDPWKYTGGARTGTLTLTPTQSLLSGAYELRYYTKNTYTALGKGPTVTVVRTGCEPPPPAPDGCTYVLVPLDDTNTKCGTTLVCNSPPTTNSSD